MRDCRLINSGKGLIAALTLGFGALMPPLEANANVLASQRWMSTGATGIDVGGVLYDVLFMDGSCNSLFAGCNSASFPSIH
jgi:hypothetical protein